MQGELEVFVNELRVEALEVVVSAIARLHHSHKSVAQLCRIESDDGAYEVEMVDKNGIRIDTHVYPATAEILRGYDD
jgi:hypothetical protein